MWLSGHSRQAIYSIKEKSNKLSWWQVWLQLKKNATEVKWRKREKEREREWKKNRIALKPMPRPHPNEVCFRPHTVRNLELPKVVTKWWSDEDNPQRNPRATFQQILGWLEQTEHSQPSDKSGMAASACITASYTTTSRRFQGMAILLLQWLPNSRPQQKGPPWQKPVDCAFPRNNYV